MKLLEEVPEHLARALVEGDLTPPPVDHLPLSRNHCLCRGASLSLSRLSRLSLSPEPHPQRHQHRAQHVTRALGTSVVGPRQATRGAVQISAGKVPN